MTHHRYLRYVEVRQGRLRKSAPDSQRLYGRWPNLFKKKSGSLILILLILRISILSRATLAESVSDSAAQQARIVIEKHCFSCHGTSEISGLDLRYRDKILKGGKRGPA